MLGIPFEDYHMLSSNVAVRASGSSTAKDAAAAQQELQEYMENLVGWETGGFRVYFLRLGVPS